MSRFLCGPCRIKESRRLVLPRTYCLLPVSAKILHPLPYCPMHGTYHVNLIPIWCDHIINIRRVTDITQFSRASSWFVLLFSIWHCSSLGSAHHVREQDFLAVQTCYSSPWTLLSSSGVTHLLASYTRLRSLLRHYATSRKFAGSIPDEVIGFFNWPNLSGRTMALGSTQPLTEMSTRNLPRG
jgi:hypothetical protein